MVFSCIIIMGIISIMFFPIFIIIRCLAVSGMLQCTKRAVIRIIFNWCNNLFRPGDWQLFYTWASCWWQPSSCWICWSHRCQIPILKFDEMPEHWPPFIVPDFCFVTWYFMNTGIQEMGTMQQRLVHITGFTVQSVAYIRMSTSLPQCVFVVVLSECNS